MTRTLRLLALAMATLALLAACDDDADDVEAPTTTVAPVDETDETDDTADETDDTLGDDTAGGVALETETTDDFGDVLRDGEGFALYAFTDDTETTSACTGGCADLWPPLMGDAADVTVGEGLDEGLVGSITRDDGSSQVSYGGHPLYHYTPDEEPGDATGQGIGGKWFQVMPDGSLAM